jgi:hypothetical protein
MMSFKIRLHVSSEVQLPAPREKNDVSDPIFQSGYQQRESRHALDYESQSQEYMLVPVSAVKAVRRPSTKSFYP